MADNTHHNISIEEIKSIFLPYMKNSPSFDDKIEDGVNRIKDSCSDSVALNDSYGNSLLSIGTDDESAKFSDYKFSNDTLNYLLWMTLYNSSWVFKKAIDKPSQDEIRCGVTLQGTEDKSDVYKLLKSATFDLIQARQWSRLFGGSIVVMMFDNISDGKKDGHNEYAEKMNFEKISQSKIIKYYVTDRWYGCSPSDETVDDMSDKDFGKPKFYNITFADGTQLRVHHDYILRFEGRTAPKLIKNGQLQGWGYAEGAHILDELMKDDKLATSIQSLIDKSLIEVIQMSGMRGLFMGGDEEAENQIRKRLEMVNWGRNFNSLTFLDKDDTYTEHGFGGLGGLSDLMEKNMWRIAAAVDMQGILFGDLKGGFSNDVEALERYDDVIQGSCESYVRPAYEKLLTVLYKMSNINEKVEFTFNSLLSKQQTEKQMENIDKWSTVLSKMLGDGVITPKQYAQSIKSYVEKGVIDLHITENDVNELDNTVKEEIEGIDLS